MGPSGSAILLTIAAIAVGTWFYFKAPSSVGSEQLQMYAGYESNMEVVSLAMCEPPGCAAIYLTPTIGKTSMEALPGAVALADELRRQGVTCYLVIGEEPIADAVKRARALHRQIVMDPGGEWAKSSGIEKAPAWLAWRSGGKIVLRSGGAVSPVDVASALR